MEIQKFGGTRCRAARAVERRPPYGGFDRFKPNVFC
jgi:hypothetical protein